MTQNKESTYSTGHNKILCTSVDLHSTNKNCQPACGSACLIRRKRNKSSTRSTHCSSQACNPPNFQSSGKFHQTLCGFSNPSHTRPSTRSNHSNHGTVDSAMGKHQPTTHLCWTPRAPREVPSHNEPCTASLSSGMSLSSSSCPDASGKDGDARSDRRSFRNQLRNSQCQEYAHATPDRHQSMTLARPQATRRLIA